MHVCTGYVRLFCPFQGIIVVLIAAAAGLGRADQDEGQLSPDQGRPGGQQGHLRSAHGMLPGDPHVCV